MTKQFKTNDDLDGLFDATSDRYYDHAEKRISTIPMGDLSTYISEKR
jgi:hypothetical protein